MEASARTQRHRNRIFWNSEQKSFPGSCRRARTDPELGIWVRRIDFFSCHQGNALKEHPCNLSTALSATSTGSRSIWSAPGTQPLPRWLGAHIIMHNEGKIITAGSGSCWSLHLPLAASQIRSVPVPHKSEVHLKKKLCWRQTWHVDILVCPWPKRAQKILPQLKRLKDKI